MRGIIQGLVSEIRDKISIGNLKFGSEKPTKV